MLLAWDALAAPGAIRSWGCQAEQKAKMAVEKKRREQAGLQKDPAGAKRLIEQSLM